MTARASRSFAEILAARAAPLRRRIGFPEAADPRVRRAAAALKRRGIVEPVLLNALGDAESGSASAEDTLAKAMRMLADGAVDGVVAGAVHPTAAVARAALRHVGLRAGARTLSSCFFLDLHDFRGRGREVLTFADPAVVPDPRPGQLAEIAAEAVRLRRLVVGDDPVVAFLSYATRGSAAGPFVDKMRAAARLFRDSHPGVPSGGEMQADVALAPAVARSKWPGSTVRGEANILVFPTLDAANIAYKLVQRLAGAAAFGPILQGLAAPANDLSRGASEQDVAAVAVITALMAGAGPQA